MAFGEFNDDGNNKLMSEINIIPLVDVMLVLLILFIITAPLFTPHAVKIDLPKASSEPNPNKPKDITLAIDKEGKLFWNDTKITDTEFMTQLAQIAQQTPQPELHLRADKTTQYQRLAEVMSAAHKAGITRLGFITEPKQ